MQFDVHNLEGKKVETVELNDSIFNIEPNSELIASVVQWRTSQKYPFRAKTLNRSEVKGTTQKYGRQKGGGGARHGSKKANIFRSGGMAHSLKGDRSVKSLSRKAKKLGMIHALSSKMKDKNIILIDDLKAKEAKTSKIKKHLENLSIKSAFIVEGEAVDSNFALSIRNLKDVKFTASEGINVYDIIKYEKLILSKNALSSIEKKVLSQ